MSEPVTSDAASRLSEAASPGPRAVPGPADSTRNAFARLTDVRGVGEDTAGFPVAAAVSADRAAALLGVSPIRVVRLIDRGVVRAETDEKHQQISPAELARFHTETRQPRRAAMAALTGEITAATPADRVVQTR